MWSTIKKTKQGMYHNGDGDNIKEPTKIAPMVGQEGGGPEA